jgi:RimJ/RimL family protein N-acetyltransferase/GNAT superfamily N-acetyltransferase
MAGYPRHTARLSVRIMRSSDIPTLVAYRADPRVAELQSWDLPYTADDAQWLAGQDHLVDLAERGWTQLAVDLDGCHVGDVAVHLDDTGQQAQIGFTLAHAVWGRGLAAEAAGAVLADLFQRRGVMRVTGACDPRNLASQRTLEAIGLSHSHDEQQSFFWRGSWADTTYYAVTAAEWQAWRDRPIGPPTDVALVPIDPTTAHAWRTVRTHHSQRRFVASVDDSYADALFPDDWRGGRLVPVLRGVLADGERAGFLMYATVTPSMPTPYLWRLLIDRRHQRRGIGRRALAALADELRAAGASQVWATFAEGVGGPRDFYLGLGGRLTGEIIDEETAVILDLDRLLRGDIPLDAAPRTAQLTGGLIQGEQACVSADRGPIGGVRAGVHDPLKQADAIAGITDESPAVAGDADGARVREVVEPIRRRAEASGLPAIDPGGLARAGQVWERLVE